MSPYHHHQKVMFQHCDPAGIVFYPRYFEMINAAVESWFEDALQVPFSDLHFGRGSAIPTATINTTFTAPSRLGDLLDLSLTVLKIGGASLDLAINTVCQDIHRFNTTLTLVHVDKESGKPKAWPQDIRKTIDNLMKETS